MSSRTVAPSARDDVRVDERVIRRGVASHQLHRGPVLLAGLAREIEPGQVGELLRQLRVLLTREPAVVLGHLGARAAAAGVAEEREVLAGREAHGGVEHRQQAELDEVIAAAARAELRPGAVLESRGDAGDAPVRVHHGVLPALPELRADAEAGLALERATEALLIARERGHGGRSRTVSFMRQAMSTPTA